MLKVGGKFSASDKFLQSRWAEWYITVLKKGLLQCIKLEFKRRMKFIFMINDTSEDLVRDTDHGAIQNMAHSIIPGVQ